LRLHTIYSVKDSHKSQIYPQGSPGGRIDRGENPIVCAIRELTEETSQKAESIRFECVMKCRLKPDDHIEYGALYSATLRRLLPFKENKELSKIILWGSTSVIGYIDEIDKALLHMVSCD